MPCTTALRACDKSPWAGEAALADLLAAGLRHVGAKVNAEPNIDTMTVSGVAAVRVHAAAEARKVNLRVVDEDTVGIALDETTMVEDVALLLSFFSEVATAVLEARLAAPGAQGDEFPPRTPGGPCFSRTRPLTAITPSMSTCAVIAVRARGQIALARTPILGPARGPRRA